jgi:hypothetical protein
MRGLEEGGIVEFTKDADGDPIGLVINLSARMEGKGALSANLEVVPPPS